MCLYARAVTVVTENIHSRTQPNPDHLFPFAVVLIYFSPLNTKLILCQYARSDGGANVLGTVLGHGLLWNPQASELLCALSIPGDSEGIPD